MSLQISDVNAWNENGFAILSDIIDSVTCDGLIDAISPFVNNSIGNRILLSTEPCRKLAVRLRAHPSLNAILARLIAVQCTYFEKSAERNWLVPIHQDLSIPVAERVEHKALTGWSEKEELLYVQPPVSLLEQLVGVRVHLDDCSADDGPLSVVPGSHRHGRLSLADADKLRSINDTMICIAPRGSVLLMKPLLLHASSKSTGTSRRRVLHFLFGPAELPFGLKWRRVCEGAVSA